MRRLFNYLEESILNGTQWVVFEPNDQALWAKIRRTIAAFLVNGVAQGRAVRLHPGRGVLRQVRRRDQPGRGHRRRPGGLRDRRRAGQAGRVRDLPARPVLRRHQPGRRAGFAGLFSGTYILPTALLGLMSATGLMLVYSLNTWLPELMRRVGYEAKGSLAFLLVLNGGAIVGALIGSRLADRLGPKPVVAACFLIGAVAIALLTLSLPLAMLLLIVAFAGLGTSGTQTLIYGFVANYYRTNVRGAAVAWCAGFGRLGGVGGPLLGGFLISAGLALDSIFYVLAGLGLLGLVLTLLVPVARGREVTTITIEPAKPGGVAEAGASP